MGYFFTMLGTCRFCSSLDSWIWSLDSSKTFTVKSLMIDLIGSSDVVLSKLYSLIWKDCYPKRIKFSFGSLAGVLLTLMIVYNIDFRIFVTLPPGVLCAGSMLNLLSTCFSIVHLPINFGTFFYLLLGGPSVVLVLFWMLWLLYWWVILWWY